MVVDIERNPFSKSLDPPLVYKNLTFTLNIHFPIIVMVSALDSQYRSPGFKTAGWLKGQLSILLFWGCVNEYQELLGTDW